MKIAPYSLTEAIQVCKEYQYLVGQSFSDELQVPITAVIISPFDQQNKKRFMMFYFLFNSAATALAHEYNGLLYDVIVVASSEDGYASLHEELNVWRCNNQVTFVSPVHELYDVASM